MMLEEDRLYMQRDEDLRMTENALLQHYDDYS